MNSLTYKKIANGLAIVGILIIVLVPDVILEWITELFHLLLEWLTEFLDISFEWIESLLDHLVESIFETSLHTTQIIVFYVMVSFAALIAYRLWLWLPKLYKRILDRIVVMFEVNKVRIFMYWYGMTLFDKVKWITAAGAIILGYVFLGL